MQKSLKQAYNSIGDISVVKTDNAVAKSLTHKLKVVTNNKVIGDLDSEIISESVISSLVFKPWAERQVQFAPGTQKRFFDHCGDSCRNCIAVIGIGNSVGNSGLGQKLAEFLPALTRQSICYFDIGTNYEQIESCMAHHSHVIIANCADTTEGPAMSFLNLANLRRVQQKISSKVLTTYEIKQPYVMRKDDGISSADQNIQIADELAYISLNRSLPRIWMFLINANHEATNTILATAKSNASLGQRNSIEARSCDSDYKTNSDNAHDATESSKDLHFAPDMEAVMPSLILRLQTLINDLLSD